MFSENEKQIEYEKFAEFVAKFCEDSLKFSKLIKIVIIRNIFSIYSLGRYRDLSTSDGSWEALPRPGEEG